MLTNPVALACGLPQYIIPGSTRQLPRRRYKLHTRQRTRSAGTGARKRRQGIAQLTDLSGIQVLDIDQYREASLYRAIAGQQPEQRVVDMIPVLQLLHN